MVLAAFVLTAQLFVVAAIYSAYALVPPTHSDVVFHWDLDTAKGFERVMMDPGVRFSDSPVFVLRQGTTGSLNITLTSFEKQITVLVGSWKYGGIPPWNSGWSAGGGPYYRTLDGITYKFNPSNLTLTPGSHATVTMQITAAPDTEVRSYNLSVSLELTGINIEQVGYSTILTIVEGNPLTANTTNTTTSSGSVPQMLPRR
ncbi:MAG: hypothetical protein A3K61_03090 [Thaumarchaeota archaeon RBG_16_49_8]|nr:MAG: hypothetical protein A3K61_03090 [Thaumarchaeota archaeon RBG_16_49_8]